MHELLYILTRVVDLTRTIYHIIGIVLKTSVSEDIDYRYQTIIIIKIEFYTLKKYIQIIKQILLSHGIFILTIIWFLANSYIFTKKFVFRFLLVF